MKRIQRGPRLARAEEVRVFVAANGRLPVRDDDHSLVVWMSQRIRLVPRRCARRRVRCRALQHPWLVVEDQRPAAHPADDPSVSGGRTTTSTSRGGGVADRADVERIAEFVAGHGRLPVAGDDVALVRVVGRFRSLHRRSRLSPEVVALLERIPAWQWAPAPATHRARSNTLWNARVADLSRFLDEHERVPRWRAPDPAERSLAVWYSTQASRRTAGTLADHRVADLDTIRRQRVHWAVGHVRWSCCRTQHVRRSSRPVPERSSTQPRRGTPGSLDWHATRLVPGQRVTT